MSTHNLLFVFVSMQTFIVPITTEWEKISLKNHTFTYVFALLSLYLINHQVHIAAILEFFKLSVGSFALYGKTILSISRLVLKHLSFQPIQPRDALKLLLTKYAINV